jgi:hypothetical protein
MKMKTNKTLGSKLSKRVFSFILLGVLISFGMNSFAQKANFSGKWTFNEGKSQMGEGRFRAPASKMTVTQSEAALSIERTAKNRDGEDVTTTEKYTLDGKVSENPAMMNSVKKSTVAWSADNKTLTISSTTAFERDGNTMEMKAVEAFTLSADGNSLTLVSTSSSQMGERTQTLAYDKAK